MATDKLEQNIKNEKRKKRRKIILGVLVGYLAIMLIGYLGVSYYFSRHFFEGTRINGVDSSKKTIEEVKADIISKIDSYTLTVELRGGGTEVIRAQEIKREYVDDHKVDQLMAEQNQYKWIFSFSDENRYDFSAGTTYDKDLIEPRMKELSCFQENNIENPKNAYIKDNGTTYEIIPEIEGNELNWEKTKEVIIEALDRAEARVSLEEYECYETPKIYRDNKALNKKKNALNTITAVDISYDFGDERIEKVDRATIQDWMVEGKKGTYSIDPAKVEAFVASMAKKYDTFGLSRTFKTYGGRTITLPSGDYGWCINKAATSAALLEAIEQGVEETIEPVWLYSAKAKGVNDIGGTYVEISIEQQRMWLFKDGVCIVDTPIVSGNISRGHGTPTNGCWAIDGRKRNAILVGEDYEAPVDYWLPFNGDVGIHDLASRTEYGGEIYKTEGSHGCINTPYDNAKKIFENVEIGTPVIVY